MSATMQEVCPVGQTHAGSMSHQAAIFITPVASVIFYLDVWEPRIEIIRAAAARISSICCSASFDSFWLRISAD